jgi:hypothetical protein
MQYHRAISSARVPTIGRTVVRPYIAPSMDGRRAVVAAGDYVRFRSLRFAPTHIHRPFYVAFQGGNFNLT